MSDLVVHSAVVFDGFGIVPEDSVRIRGGRIVELGRGLRAGASEDSLTVVATALPSRMVTS